VVAWIQIQVKDGWHKGHAQGNTSADHAVRVQASLRGILDGAELDKAESARAAIDRELDLGFK
jgi:hypothetical protein